MKQRSPSVSRFSAAAAILWAVASILLIATAASATVRYVPEQHATIQLAIQATVNGDTVLVNRGTYRENISFLDRTITVASYYLTTGDPSYIDNTRIEAAVGGIPVVEISGGQGRGALLTGFTIAFGSGPQGGGVLCLGTSPTIDHNTIRDNCVRENGGGICTYDGGPRISYNRIVFN